MVLSTLFLMGGIVTRQPVAVLVSFSLALACAGASEGPFWMTAVELGRARGGTSAGIFNTGGNAGGLLAPMVTPLFSRYFGWRGGLALAGVFCLLGATLWYWIVPVAPASPSDSASGEVKAE
jgi:sugar phosphate permease